MRKNKLRCKQENKIKGNPESSRAMGALETAKQDAAGYAPHDKQEIAALLPGLDPQEAKQYRTLLGTRKRLAGQRRAAVEGVGRVRQEHGVINSRGYSPEATRVNPTTALPQGRPASVAPTLTKAQRNLQRLAEKGTAGQKRFAQRKLEEQKACFRCKSLLRNRFKSISQKYKL